MISKKMLDKIALFVQDLLREKPMKYSEVREMVCKKYGLTKNKAGNVLHILKGRSNFLFYAFAYEKLYNGVLYLPEHESKARELFKSIGNGIPLEIRWANKKLHKYLLQKTRRIKIENPELPADLLAEILKWKLKINKYLARKLIGEVEAS